MHGRRRQRRHRAMGDTEEAIATLLRNKAVTGMTHHQPPPPWPTAVKVSGQGTVPRPGTRSPQRRSRQGARGRLCRPRRAMQGPRERGEISTHQFCQMKHSRTYMYIYYWFSSCFCRGWILHVHERLSLNPVSNSTVHCIHSWGIRYLMTMCASAS
jgi:hypothetical protein